MLLFFLFPHFSAASSSFLLFELFRLTIDQSNSDSLTSHLSVPPYLPQLHLITLPVDKTDNIYPPCSPTSFHHLHPSNPITNNHHHHHHHNPITNPHTNTKMSSSLISTGDESTPYESSYNHPHNTGKAGAGPTDFSGRNSDKDSNVQRGAFDGQGLKGRERSASGGSLKGGRLLALFFLLFVCLFVFKSSFRLGVCMEVGGNLRHSAGRNGVVLARLLPASLFFSISIHSTNYIIKFRHRTQLTNPL